MKTYTIEFYLTAEEGLTINDIDLMLYKNLKHSNLDWDTGSILEIEDPEDNNEE